MDDAQPYTRVTPDAEKMHDTELCDGGTPHSAAAHDEEATVGVTSAAPDGGVCVGDGNSNGADAASGHCRVRMSPHSPVPGGTMQYPYRSGGMLSQHVGVFPFWGERVGRMKAARQGRCECYVGPCWPMPVVTTLIILFIGGLLVHSVAGKVHPVLCAIGVLGVLMTVVSFWFTACTNPGVSARYPERPPDCEDWPYHEGSDSYHPPGCKWCDECEVFMRQYDHFCPWTGTTIAGGNIKYFYLFVTSMCFTLFYFIALIVLHM